MKRLRESRYRETLVEITACRRCHKAKCHRSRTPWCRKCRWAIHRQRGKARWVEQSIWTRRLQARLKSTR